MIRRIGALVVAALALTLAPAPLFADALEYYGTDQDPRDLPGTPRTPLQIYRRLVEDGFVVLGTPYQVGAVYFVGVQTPQKRPRCLILHAFSGVILQRFSRTHDGFAPEIRDAPGPGFPGYPAGPSGRYAELCALALPLDEHVRRAGTPIRELY